MSYCRFSSDNFSCDAYVYEDISGVFTIHLASSRVIGDIPKLVSILDGTVEECFDAYNEQMKFLNTAKREKITLEYSGETFNVEEPEECADALIKFQKIGYKIPQYAIDNLLEESI